MTYIHVCNTYTLIKLNIKHLYINKYRSGTANSNTVNAKSPLIRSSNQDFAGFLSFHV